MPRDVVERQAKLLAKENRQAEPQISKVYWFPDDNEVRLVELHSEVPSSGDQQLHPYFFRPSPEDNLPAPTGVALIQPDEFGCLGLPPGWGKWDDVVELEDDQ